MAKAAVGLETALQTRVEGEQLGCHLILRNTHRIMDSATTTPLPEHAGSTPALEASDTGPALNPVLVACQDDGDGVPVVFGDFQDLVDDGT